MREAQGETEAVAIAIYDHYKPVSMEDSIPRTLEGQIVSLADKLDTLVSAFGSALSRPARKIRLRSGARLRASSRFSLKRSCRFRSTELIEDVPALPDFIEERIAILSARRSRLRLRRSERRARCRPRLRLQDLAERAEAIHYVRPTAGLRTPRRQLQAHQEYPEAGAVSSG